MNLWLDDLRPAPDGWIWVKTMEQAQTLLQTGEVINASLDHDLGPEDYANPAGTYLNNGYALCRWMEATGYWPRNKPAVHSMNPVGAARMREIITDNWGE